MKILAMLALLTSSLTAGELIEVTEVLGEAVPGAREVSYTYGEKREVLHLQNVPLVVGKDVAEISTSNEPKAIEVVLTAEGAKKLAEKTKDMSGKRLAILVDGKVLAAPVLRTVPLGGRFQVTGFKDEAEAKAFVEEFAKKQRAEKR